LRPASTLAAAAAVAFVVVVAGCAAASGAGDPDDPGGEPTPGTTGSDAGSRPGFDASFDAASPDDAGQTDASPPPDGGGTCTDTDDPGDSETVAKQLPNQDDCDNGVKNVSGVLNGVVDVDFYKLTITDKFGCSIDSSFETPTSGVEMCVFLKCVNNNPIDLKGCGGGAATTDIGMKGCCTKGPGKPSPNWSCSSGLDFNDSANIFVRIKQSSSSCTPYTFSYRF
jgi:hypothetical protein